jgi:chromosome segregation ATPase
MCLYSPPLSSKKTSLRPISRPPGFTPFPSLPSQRRLDVERTRIDHGPMTGSHYMVQLKDERDDAEAELVLLQESISSLKVDERQTLKEITAVEAQVETLKENTRTALIPHIEELQADIRRVEQDIADERARVEDGEAELARAREMTAEAETELARADSLYQRELLNLNKVSGRPEALRRQCELIGIQHKQQETLLDSLNIKQHELQGSLQKMSERHETLLATERDMEAQLMRFTSQAAKKDRAIAGMQESLNQRLLQNEQLSETGAQLEIELGHAKKELRNAEDDVARQTRGKDQVIRRLKKAEQDARHAEDAIPGLKSAFETLKVDLSRDKAELAALEGACHIEKEKVNQVRKELLKQDSIGKEVLDILGDAQRRVAEYDDDIARRKVQMDEIERHIRYLASKRDQSARLVSSNNIKYREANELVALKNLVIKDLKKQRKEITSRVREFEQLFELVKNQRNKFMNLIMTASQGSAEMREKLKILANEIDILRSESSEMDGQLGRQRHDYQLVLSERDAQQNEHQRMLKTFSARQDMVDAQISQMDKMNALVNRAEKVRRRRTGGMMNYLANHVMLPPY